MSHVDFKELAHKIMNAWQHYLNLIQAYNTFKGGVFTDEMYRQEQLYVSYRQAHKAWCSYLNYVYEFKCNLTGDLSLEVDYLDIVGIWLPGTTETIYFQVVFDGECDSQITMSLNGTYEVNVGGLPSGTIFFTKRMAYIIEGDEIVKFKG